MSTPHFQFGAGKARAGAVGNTSMTDSANGIRAIQSWDLGFKNEVAEAYESSALNLYPVAGGIHSGTIDGSISTMDFNSNFFALVTGGTVASSVLTVSNGSAPGAIRLEIDQYDQYGNLIGTVIFYNILTKGLPLTFKREGFGECKIDFSCYADPTTGKYISLAMAS